MVKNVGDIFPDGGGISPRSLSFSDFLQHVSELKRECTELSQEQWGAVYALKNGVDAVFAPTKQKRYASQIRLEAQAEDGNAFASELARVLLGRPESSIAN